MSRFSWSRLPEFKRAAAEALQIARSETGVLQYEWSFDDAETLCVVHETYEDFAALLEHMANVSVVFARLIIDSTDGATGTKAARPDGGPLNRPFVTSTTRPRCPSSRRRMHSRAGACLPRACWG